MRRARKDILVINKEIYHFLIWFLHLNTSKFWENNLLLRTKAKNSLKKTREDNNQVKRIEIELREEWNIFDYPFFRKLLVKVEILSTRKKPEVIGKRKLWTDNWMAQAIFEWF